MQTLLFFVARIFYNKKDLIINISTIVLCALIVYIMSYTDIEHVYESYFLRLLMRFNVTTTFFNEYQYYIILASFIFFTATLLFFHQSTKYLLIKTFFLLNIFYCVLFALNLHDIPAFNYSDELQQIKFALDKSNDRAWDRNVYVIVMDGYPRYDSLISNLDFDNKDFLSKLSSYGFTIIEKSRSNYPITFLSLHSMLTASYPYLDDAPAYSRSVAYTFLGGNNPAVDRFKENGYKYIHVGSGAWEGSKLQAKDSIEISKSLHFGLSSEVLTLILNGTYFAGQINFIDDVIITIKDIQDQMKFHLMEHRKIFLFAHTLPPHAPYIFDCNCNKKFKFEGTNLGSTQTSKKNFLENLLCANKQALSLAEYLNKNDPEAIVVFLSDHGSDFNVDWNASPEEWTEGAIEERFANFIAIKAPKEYSDKYLYSGMSLVNIFPFIFGCLNKIEPNFLEDISYSVGYENIKAGKLFHRVTFKEQKIDK